MDKANVDMVASSFTSAASEVIKAPKGASKGSKGARVGKKGGKGGKGSKGVKGGKGGTGRGKNGRVDGPTTGQSAPHEYVAYGRLNGNEQKLVDFLNGTGVGLRATFTITEISAIYFDTAETAKRANSWTRNSLRRAVTADFVERVDSGAYRITEAGRKRLQRAQVAESIAAAEFEIVKPSEAVEPVTAEIVTVAA